MFAEMVWRSFSSGLMMFFNFVFFWVPTFWISAVTWCEQLPPSFHKLHWAMFVSRSTRVLPFESSKSGWRVSRLKNITYAHQAHFCGQSRKCPPPTTIYTLSVLARSDVVGSSAFAYVSGFLGHFLRILSWRTSTEKYKVICTLPGRVIIQGGQMARFNPSDWVGRMC